MSWFEKAKSVRSDNWVEIEYKPYANTVVISVSGLNDGISCQISYDDWLLLAKRVAK